MIIVTNILIQGESNMSVTQLKQDLNLPFAQALNSVSANIFYADKDFNLVFINSKGLETLASIDEEVKNAFGFSSSSILGRNIDEFHQNPAHQRKMLLNERNFPINNMSICLLPYTQLN